MAGEKQITFISCGTVYNFLRISDRLILFSYLYRETFIQPQRCGGIWKISKYCKITLLIKFFIFSAFQYLGVLFTYNMNCRHRKNYDTNKLYMLYISICMFLCIISISSKSIDLFEVIKNFLNSTIIFSKEDINYIKREFLALVVILTNFSFTFIYGSFLERITD